MGAAIGAAVAARRQRELLGAFESREATSEATALSLATLGLDRNHLFRSFERRGVIRAAADDRFWLDRQALGAWRAEVQVIGVRIVLGVFAVSVIITAIIIALAQRG